MIDERFAQVVSTPGALPIGVFDSGVGGLTVLRAIRQALPAEDLLYLGDTARLPYGTKSAGTVRRYALNAAAHLLAQGIKLLVIACNTASSSALAAVADAAAPTPVVGVVEPGVRAALASGAQTHRGARHGGHDPLWSVPAGAVGSGPEHFGGRGGVHPVRAAGRGRLGQSPGHRTDRHPLPRGRPRARCRRHDSRLYPLPSPHPVSRAGGWQYGAACGLGHQRGAGGHRPRALAPPPRAGPTLAR